MIVGRQALNVLHLLLSKHHRIGARKTFGARISEVCGETILPGNDFINKTGTMAVSMGMLMGKTENFMGSHP